MIRIFIYGVMVIGTLKYYQKIVSHYSKVISGLYSFDSYKVKKSFSRDLKNDE